MNDQAYELRKILDKKKTINAPKVLSVTSGKGGVGKTSIVVNLSILLASKGKKVLIFDADLGLANIDVMLGLTPRYNIKHVLDGECSLDEVLLDGPQGIKIIPASSGIQELADLTDEQQMTLINALDYFEEEMDYMFVDTGAGISRNVMYFNSAASSILVVVTPEPTSITDAYALIKVLRKKHGVRKFNLIVNNVQSKIEGDEVSKKLIMVCERFLGDVTLDMLGSIPHDLTIPECIKEQKAFIEAHGGTEVARRLESISRRLEKSAYEDSNTGGNLQFFLQRMLLNDVKGTNDARHGFPRSY